jgi:glycosyltransferase involved in cell wall biosynthesis
MRIAHLLRKLDPAQWGGTETAIQRLFEGLRAQGVSPVAYCPRLETESNQDPLERSGFQVRRFKAFVPVLGLNCQRKAQMRAVGGNLMSLELINDLWRDRELSLIHSHALGRIGAIGRAVARRRGVPLVITIHGGLLDLPPNLRESMNHPNGRGLEWGKLFGLLLRSHRLLPDAGAILTCNPREAELLRQKFPTKRIVVQPHGIPLELYRRDQRAVAHEAYPQIQGRQVLLCLGRVDPVKNQAWVLEQAPALFHKHPSVLLVLAGPCTDEAYGRNVKRKIQELGLKERVLCTGGLPPDDPGLIGLLQMATAVILPSLSETFGLVILEAWAAGTMVLSSRTSGPSALIESGKNGWLFDLDKPQTFHEALDRILRFPQLSQTMIERGARVAEQYSIQAIAGRVKSLYEELIEQKGLEAYALRDYS